MAFEMTLKMLNFERRMFLNSNTPTSLRGVSVGAIGLWTREETTVVLMARPVGRTELSDAK